MLSRRRRAVLAPDSFKGTYAAPAVASAIAEGLSQAGVETIELPVADGGEGTLDVLARPLDLTMLTVASINAWGRPVAAPIGMSPSGIAVVEVARTCGLHIPHEGVRDPVAASTFGVGRQILAAAGLGATHIIVAAGGSATTDGGAGAVIALQDMRLRDLPRLTVLSDVRTPYLQAAEVFGPQKGATPTDVLALTARLELIRGKLPRDPQPVAGSGAAGGLAGALWAYADASIVSGADFILDVLDFDQFAATADLVVTGEGRLDGQTAEGKIVSRVRARAGETPVHAVVGSVDPSGVDEGEFATVTVASTVDEMRRAGRTIGADLSSERVLPVFE